MIDLKAAKVIITGGSAGVGLEMTRALAQRGAAVTIIARDRDNFSDAHAAGARSIAGDATEHAVIDRAIADVSPDVLILSAGARLHPALIDEQDWETFSQIWNADVKATFVGIQAALKTPMRPGTRVLIMSSGAAMVMSHPAINPYDLRHSNGCVGAKRMVWFMGHQANAASAIRRLGIKFQVLVPGQLMAATGHGRIIAEACAKVEGITVDEHILRKYGSHLQPAQIGRQVAELLSDSHYDQGVAYGFRHNADIIPFDQ
jgi:NAD(P)-dependent dehydrogenase (short-subunit alcohol dehydrogenase family)